MSSCLLLLVAQTHGTSFDPDNCRVEHRSVGSYVRFMHRCCARWLAKYRRQQQQRPFNGLWSGTNRVGRYQKELSPTHTHPNHCASFIIFLHLQRFMASSLFSLRAWQSSRTTSFQVFFGFPLGLEPSTSCSIHFFTQSSSSFRNTWPYQRSLFCCNTNAANHYTTPFTTPRRQRCGVHQRWNWVTFCDPGI